MFVNTVSLGLYADIRSPQYRDAKLDTTLSARLLGPESRPFDLRFTGPAGERHRRAVVHVSNNPYGRTPTTLAAARASTVVGSGWSRWSSRTPCGCGVPHGGCGRPAGTASGCPHLGGVAGSP